MFLPEVGSQPDLTLLQLCHLEVWGSWLGAARGCERLILALWRRLVHNSPPTPSTEPAASRLRLLRACTDLSWETRDRLLSRAAVSPLGFGGTVEAKP